MAVPEDKHVLVSRRGSCGGFTQRAKSMAHSKLFSTLPIGYHTDVAPSTD